MKKPSKDFFHIFTLLLKNRTSLGDVLVVAVAQKHLLFISTMVTWDKVLFGTIVPGAILNPYKLL